MRTSALALLAALGLAFSALSATSAGHRKLANRAALSAVVEPSAAVEKRTALVSNKKGLGYNTASYTLAFGNSIAWVYNWANAPGGTLTSGVEFFPMLWGQKDTMLPDWVAAAQAAIDGGSRRLLGFNEPNEPLDVGGSAIDYGTAAALYKQYITPFGHDGVYLISPAVSNGAAGLTYLQNFMGACGDCKIAAVAVHWYDSATNVSPLALCPTPHPQPPH